MNPYYLPSLNAFLNGLAGVFLFLGWRSIKRGERKIHQNMMISALVCSTLFLVSYLTYHYMIHGGTRYQGQGFSRILYFTILITHTPLATLIVPFCLMAVWHGIKGNLDKHVRITRWLLPVWAYVAVTGVLIYCMLYVFKAS